MQTIIAFLQNHGIGTIIMVFTVISIVLGAVASVLQALGDKVPGWIGTGISAIGSILHALNGNVVAALPAKDPGAPAA